MYTIIKRLDGKFHCEFKLQDSTERYTYDTLEEAIKEAKKFAEVLNGTKIKRKHIDFYEEKLVTETKFVKWKPEKVKK